jgi:hypothetical protein
LARKEPTVTDPTEVETLRAQLEEARQELETERGWVDGMESDIAFWQERYDAARADVAPLRGAAELALQALSWFDTAADGCWCEYICEKCDDRRHVALDALKRAFATTKGDGT